MSNYLRDVLGADNSSSEFAQPQGLVADVGPDIPGGEGANKGAWRDQLRDRLGQFAKMFGLVLFDIEIEGIGRVTGHGELIDIVRPGVGLVRIKNHKVLGDIDMEMLGEQLEAIDAIIPDADYERVTGKDVTPNTEPTPELKDSITGDEAMQVVRNAGAEYAKSQGRFPMARTYDDIKQGLRSQYAQLFEGIKQDNPELLKNKFIINEDGTGRTGDIETEDDFWGVINALKVDTGNRWVAPENIDPLAKEINRRYAEKFLGIKKDGLITFYRNVTQEKENPAEAAAGYISLDKKMAWDYNSQKGYSTDVNKGRYIVKAKPDEVLGILGLSGAVDEFGVVISPEVTSLPGRFEKVGGLEKQKVDTAPWLDSERLDSTSRLGGGSPFRFLAPMANFDYYPLDSNPFGEGTGWSSFYAANGLEQGAMPNKYNELYGEGAWEKDFGDGSPRAASFTELFVEFTDEQGNKKWGLNGLDLRNLSNQDMLNNAESGDDFDRNIKVLSTMQELIGKPFFVNKGHSKNDPRLDEVKDEEPVVEKTPEPEVEKPWLNVQYSDEEEEETELTEEEIEKLALENYSVNLYKYINQYLREGREGIVDSDTFTSNPFYVDQIVQSAESIKKAFNKESNVLPEDTTLSRLVPRFVGENLKPGDTLEDAAILSTTKNPKESGTKNMFHRSVINKLRGSYGETYGESEPTKVGWTVYEIEAPKGTKAIDMEGIGELDEEGEVLLPPNTKLEVVSVEDRPEPDFPQATDSIFKAYTVKLRIVPEGKNDSVKLSPEAEGEKYRSDRSILTKFKNKIENATSIEEIREAEVERREWMETNGVTSREPGGSGLFTFTPEEIKKAYNYNPESTADIYNAEDMSDSEGIEFNRRMRTLAELKKPGSISNETIEDQNRLNRKNDGDTAALIEVKELRHSAPASRFDEITTNGVRPKATNKVGSENYTRRRFGVFLANGYTSPEAGERADVFRVVVPEDELRVDAGYARYGDNLYIERSINPEELEHIGHYPVGGLSEGELHSGRGAGCPDCDLAAKKRQEDQQKREEEKREKYSTPVVIYQLKYTDGGLADQHAVRYKSGADEMHMDHSIEDCPETSKNPNVALRPNGLGEDETLAEIVAEVDRSSDDSDTPIDAPLTPQGFTDEQEEVIKDYSSYGYRDVNTYLRLGRQEAIDEFATTNAEKRADEAEKAIEEINKVFETSTLEKDATLFRLVPRDIAEGVKVGDILSDPAILSTTKNPESDDINRQFNSNIFNGLERYYEDRYDGAHPNDVGWAVIEIEAPAGTKAIDIADISEFPEEREVLLPPGASLEVVSIEETEGLKNRYKRPGDIFKAYKVKVRVVPPSDAPELMKDWDSLTGLETSAEKQERIEPGFKNWNKEVEKIFEDWDNDLIVGVETYDDGNILQANFIKKAGFNEKPKVLSQEEFDAIEAETIYRGHQSTAFIDRYINSDLQYSGEGYFGNGTYTSNKRDTAENYAGSSGPDPSTQAEIDERILEMKMLPDANVLSFEEVTDLREWADQKTREFLESYEKSGANPAQYQEAEWRLFNEADYTNIAIMLGIDAIRFKVPLTDAEEYYTIILNRGKVAINGKP